MGNKFWVQCGICKLVFAPIVLPMEVDEFCDAVNKVRCPKCDATASDINVYSERKGEKDE